MESAQYVDPKISMAKFNQEMNLFKGGEEIQYKRGILLLGAEFPNAFFAFCLKDLLPAAIAFAVKINFENYDLEPLSVSFIDPFTREPIKKDRIATHFPRKVNGSPQPMMLLQQDDTGYPFFCLPGVREYHHHPAHTGDSWFLHRNKGGEGSLGFILEKLYQYGIEPVKGYKFQVALTMATMSLGLDPNKLSE